MFALNLKKKKKIHNKIQTPKYDYQKYFFCFVILNKYSYCLAYKIFIDEHMHVIKKWN